MVLRNYFLILITLSFSLIAEAKESAIKSLELDKKIKPDAIFEKGVIAFGGKILNVEIALTPEAQQKGLMFRKNLAFNHGMLFVFDKLNYHSFWMKNTIIPLSIAFIDSDKTISQISNLKPVKTYMQKKYDSVQSKSAVKYALEVKKNWFSMNGVAVGDSFHWIQKPKSLQD